MKRMFLRLFLILSSCSSIYSQSAGGAIFLLIPPSPTMNGLGGIGVSLPSDDPYSGYFNPANGLNNFQGTSYSHSKMSTPWLQSLTDDILLEYEVWNLGLIPRHYPVKFVLSFHKTFLNLGEQIRTDEAGHFLGTSEFNMKADALTLGIGYQGYLKNIPIDFSFGYTRKTVIQNFVLGKSSDDLNDYGLLFSLPFSLKQTSIKKLKLIDDAFDFNIKPSFGYSVSNIGKDIAFPSYNADPTPKYLRIGISTSTVISFKSKWNLLEWKGGRSASDELIVPRYNSDDPIKYQSGLGDVDFFKNVIKSESDSLLTIHRGDEWTILDIFTFRKGRKIDITGKIDLQTSGYGYRLAGVFKMLYFLLDDQTFEIIPKFIDVQYNYSKWEQYPGHPLHDTEFESLSITFNNIDQLIMGILK